MVSRGGHAVVEMKIKENAAGVINEVPQYRRPQGLTLIRQISQENPHAPTG